MNKVEQGKKLFLTMAIIYMTLVLFVTLLKVVDRGVLGALVAIIRTVSNIILLYYTFKGRKWAKIILTILFSIELFLVGIKVAFSIYTAIGIINYSASIASNGLGIYTIWLSPSFNEYLKSIKN
ncbi:MULTISPECIES: hypothetical protein [unclassified Clostridium]|uniref:hypothetical protein n=1 Tax=unclassified Clostridium TaxID=2614128 RepID=UPI0002983EA3|nr:MULTISPECIES: hypothetical protein [unclassified Clostridium]EKQ50984.1 MAG: hypothetical protein A370_05266 [Clostridium sp. Maddingley MBC34-26]